MDREKSLIAERAAEWLEQLEHAGPEERARFVKWLKESPQHGWEMLLAKSCDMVVAQLLKEAGISAGDIAEQVNNVRSINDRSPTRVRARARAPLWKAAAVIAFMAVLGAATVAIYAVSDRTISTAAGQWHTTQLPDGTILRAGPRTKATVDFTENQRIVRLAHGELMLHVAKDRARPFSVDTDLATARAVGTAFAVRHMERDRVSITVKEGIVAVTRRSHSTVADRASTTKGESIAVNAGEGIQVTSEPVPLAVAQVNLEKELAWTTGRLLFTTETVADAVREFNLRNDVQIRVLSPELGMRPIRGVMHVNDPNSLATLLERNGIVSVVNDQRGTLLLVPHPTGEANLKEKTEP
jgi:transmembrane sensor